MTQENSEVKNYYNTPDLALAAAISLFYPLEAINRQNPYKATFLFKRDAGLDQVIESFWRNELQVSPLLYFNQLKAIKSRLYEVHK